jgi:hypothetical protein
VQQIFYRTVKGLSDFKVNKEDMHVKYLAAIFPLSRVAFSECQDPKQKCAELTCKGKHINEVRIPTFT